ncbi:MAG: FAD/NAD(P)-binding protein [Polyangiaceae bacterium]
MSAPRIDPWLPTPLRVARTRRETRDTFTLVFDGGVGPFEPGQFNMLYLFGVGEVPISISGDPAAPEALVHTIRAVGTTTRAMQQIKRGAVVGVRGPFGRGWPVALAEGSDLLLIAGGLGLAPLRPVVYHALRHRQRYGRVVVLYGARTPGDLLFRAELARWRRAGCEVETTVDRAGSDWTGRVGVVPSLLQGMKVDPGRTVAMLCGPEVMMRFSVRALEARGVPRSQVYVSLERSMKCAVGFCGHCQLGPTFVCKDGPVVSYDRVARRLATREL